MSQHTAGIDGWSEQESMAVLAAMADVAAKGPHDDDKACRLVAAASEHVFGVDVDPAALGDTSPQSLADAVPDADKRSLAAQFLVLVPYADVTVDGAETDRVVEYADALGVHPDTVGDLRKVREGHIKRLLIDYFRRAADGVKMPNDTRGIVRRTYDEVHQYVGDKKMVARYTPLADYPEGTLGRTFFDFYRARGFALPGEKHSLGDEVVSHDCCHILAGFNTDGAGEISIAGFEAGMKSDEFGWELMMEVILDFQLGIDFGVGLVGYVPRTGELDPDRVMVAIRRGLECNTDLMSPAWDFWDDADQEVTDLREKFNITGVDEVLLDPPDHPATGD
ncbi:MAG: hypothetical protein ACR2OH_06320 [Microthrixaceae bacterium]